MPVLALVRVLLEGQTRGLIEPFAVPPVIGPPDDAYEQEEKDDGDDGTDEAGFHEAWAYWIFGPAVPSTCR